MSWITFEARQVTAALTHYPVDDLRESEVYFQVHYHDSDLLMPYVEPLVFVGCNLSAGDENTLYF